MSKDIIYKEDAIEVVCRECHEFRGLFSRIEEGINELPSADTFEITKEALIEAIDNAETVGDIVENIIDIPQGEIILQDTIQRLERVIKHGVVGKDGMHPVSAEVVLNWLKGADDE